MTKAIHEVAVMDGAIKIWRILNLNSGTLYSRPYDSQEEADIAIASETTRDGLPVKRESLPGIVAALEGEPLRIGRDLVWKWKNNSVGLGASATLEGEGRTVPGVRLVLEDGPSCGPMVFTLHIGEVKWQVCKTHDTLKAQEEAEKYVRGYIAAVNDAASRA